MKLSHGLVQCVLASGLARTSSASANGPDAYALGPSTPATFAHGVSGKDTCSFRQETPTRVVDEASVTPEHVILLHGLCRTRRSMNPMEAALRIAGYRVWNVGYASRTASIHQLSDSAISDALERCRKAGATKIHFVTHSLGGILVRSYLARHGVPEIGRVVMLAPPNQGSELVDKLGHWSLFGWLNGPAGRELGTGPTSTPNRLGSATFPLGVIAGSRSINWINSCLIPGTDDGKVSVERTKIAGMSDHIRIAATHTFIMRNRTALRQTQEFLRTGRFATPGEQNGRRDGLATTDPILCR